MSSFRAGSSFSLSPMPVTRTAACLLLMPRLGAPRVERAVASAPIAKASPHLLARCLRADPGSLSLQPAGVLRGMPRRSRTMELGECWTISATATTTSSASCNFFFRLRRASNRAKNPRAQACRINVDLCSRRRCHIAVQRRVDATTRPFAMLLRLLSSQARPPARRKTLVFPTMSSSDGTPAAFATAQIAAHRLVTKLME